MTPLEMLETQELVRFLSDLGLHVLSLDAAEGVAVVRLPTVRPVPPTPSSSRQADIRE